MMRTLSLISVTVLFVTSKCTEGSVTSPSTDLCAASLSNAVSGAIKNIIAPEIIPLQDDWRNDLPDELRNKKGAPLHKIVIKSKSNTKQKVTVYLLGTSHVSRTSSKECKVLMEYARPDILFVELCSQRVGILLSSPLTSKEKKNTGDIHRDKVNKMMTPTSQKLSVLFAKIQTDYAEKLNVTIGGEFQAAFQSALQQQRQFLNSEYTSMNIGGHNSLFSNDNNLHQVFHASIGNESYSTLAKQNSYQNNPHPRGNRPCAIILGDRPVHITLLRAWESLRFIGKLKLIIGLLWSSIRQPSMKELQEFMDSILNDRSGKNDLMTKAMEEFGKVFPTLKKVIIEERDQYMAAKLQQTAELVMSNGIGTSVGDENQEEVVIVAVVGAGHCHGMLEILKNKECIGIINKEKSNTSAKNEDTIQHRPEDLLVTLVETKKLKMSNDQEVASSVTDVLLFDYDYLVYN